MPGPSCSPANAPVEAITSAWVMMDQPPKLSIPYNGSYPVLSVSDTGATGNKHIAEND